MSDEQRIVSASRSIRADAATIFEQIVDPALQPAWDGNDNLAEAAEGQRVRAVGDTFSMTLTNGGVRVNHVVEFDEGARIAWKPGAVDGGTFGQLWRWELDAQPDGTTLVTHTYDWRGLPAIDTMRTERARRTTSERLAASIDRLAARVESG